MKINVYANDSFESVIARVEYNQKLDRWNGSNWQNGGVGLHRGITKLRDGRYVLIYGTDHQGHRDYGVVVSKEEMAKEIIESENLDLLKSKRFQDLASIVDALEE